MTLTAATGCISKAEERLRNMLAACVPLQQWMGVADAAAAKERIYLAMMPPPQIYDEEADRTFYVTELKDRRPFCIVWTDKYQMDMIASPACPNPSGTLQVVCEENVPEELQDNYSEAYRRFLNAIGEIYRTGSPSEPGLADLYPIAGYLSFRSVSFTPPVRAPEDIITTQGDSHQVLLTVEWGANQ